LLIGFLIFRVLDIFKPFPIRALEHAPAGFGIVLDDLAAGLYAFLILLVFHLYWPTLTFYD
jgi:phosphatidylglycerophosphatase A